MPTRSLFLLPFLLLSAAALADADVAIQFIAPNRFDVTMALVNHGPDVARNVVATVDIPEGLPVKQAFIGDAQCDTTVRPARCVIGDLHVGLPVNYGGLAFEAPIADATWTVTVDVTSTTPDPNRANNGFSVSWTTKIEADMAIGFLPQTDRVDPGGTAKYRVLSCNNIADNRVPENVRLDFIVENATITGISEADGFACSLTPTGAVCTIARWPTQCITPIDITAVASGDRRGGAALVHARVTTDVPERIPESNSSTGSVAIYRWIAVTNTADAGPGSFRDAIDDANRSCTPGPCRIVFEIPGPVPAEGWFTITPSEPLPPVTAARVSIEGVRQTALTGDTNPHGPEIAIDGRLARSGLKVLSPCEAVVNGLALGNFDLDQGLLYAMRGIFPGVCGERPRPDRREVADNHIGVDPSGTVPWPNLRGLSLDIPQATVHRNVISHNIYSGVWMWHGLAALNRNRVEDNGASGIFFGPAVNGAEVEESTINRNVQMGVAVARGARLIDIRGNSMKDNGGLGIDWGLDGVSPTNLDDSSGAATNAPVLLSARYDAAADKTLLTLRVDATRLGSAINDNLLNVYANDGPDGDGERPVGGARGVPWDAGPFTVELEGDLRGRWLNATFTRVMFLFSRSGPAVEWFSDGDAITSELSNSVLVE